VRCTREARDGAFVLLPPVDFHSVKADVFAVVEVPGAVKIWRALSVTTNSGYDNLFFLFLIITKNTNFL
jgi:hypothetical protein